MCINIFHSNNLVYFLALANIRAEMNHRIIRNITELYSSVFKAVITTTNTQSNCIFSTKLNNQSTAATHDSSHRI